MQQLSSKQIRAKERVKEIHKQFGRSWIVIALQLDEVTGLQLEHPSGVLGTRVLSQYWGLEYRDDFVIH